MDLGLEGVHVLVTGASGGIGLETAKLFAGGSYMAEMSCLSTMYRSRSEGHRALSQHFVNVTTALLPVWSG